MSFAEAVRNATELGNTVGNTVGLIANIATNMVALPTFLVVAAASRAVYGAPKPAEPVMGVDFVLLEGGTLKKEKVITLNPQTGTTFQAAECIADDNYFSKKCADTNSTIESRSEALRKNKYDKESYWTVIHAD